MKVSTNSLSLVLLLAIIGLIVTGCSQGPSPENTADYVWANGKVYTVNQAQPWAESVQRWLVQHGVEAERLTSKGYGATRPVAPNITAYNRSRNRRVQFTILRRSSAADDER